MGLVSVSTKSKCCALLLPDDGFELKDSRSVRSQNNECPFPQLHSGGVVLRAGASSRAAALAERERDDRRGSRPGPVTLKPIRRPGARSAPMRELRGHTVRVVLDARGSKVSSSSEFRRRNVRIEIWGRSVTNVKLVRLLTKSTCTSPETAPQRLRLS